MAFITAPNKDVAKTIATGLGEVAFKSGDIRESQHRFFH